MDEAGLAGAKAYWSGGKDCQGAVVTTLEKLDGQRYQRLTLTETVDLESKAHPGNHWIVFDLESEDQKNPFICDPAGIQYVRDHLENADQDHAVLGECKATDTNCLTQAEFEEMKLDVRSYQNKGFYVGLWNDYPLRGLFNLDTAANMLTIAFRPRETLDDDDLLFDKMLLAKLGV